MKGVENVSYVVTFNGVPTKFAAALEKMLRDDIAPYPQRMVMAGVAVAELESVLGAARKSWEKAQSRKVPPENKRKNPVGRPAGKGASDA